MIICHCAAVNDRSIRELVHAGASDLLDLADACGAGSFCGGCAPLLASVLAEETGTPATFLLARGPTPAGDRRPERFRKRAEAVVRELLDAIAADGWPVGEPLGSEDDLAARFDVTPRTVREAVRLLRHHRLVEVTGDRLLVGAPAPSAIGEAAAIHLHHVAVELDDVVEARRTIEEVMAERAALSELAEPRARLAALVENTEREPTLAEHVDFHHLLAELSGNPAFSLLIDALIRLARDLAPAAAGTAFARRRDRTAEEHGGIAAAVLARDPEAARARMAEHLDAFYGSVSAAPRVEVAARRRAHEDEHPAAALARSLAFDIRHLAPGAVLGSERDLALRCRVSRRELREAASLLELYAVAYPRPGPDRALVVATPDMWGVAQLMARYLDFTGIGPRHISEVRSALEVRAVELATDRLDEERAQRLRQRLDEEVEARSRGPGAYGFHNIHPFIAELSGNPVLALFTSALILTLVRHVRAVAEPDELAAQEHEVAEVHAGIVEAIVARDRDLARRRMRDHVQPRT